MTEKKSRAAKVVNIKAGRQSKHFDAAAREVFLVYLSGTANVTASAKKAGVSTSTAYVLRRKNEVFRAEWADALADGFARLEMELLAEALTAASGNTKDSTLKARAQKHRLALALLAAHRASVKGERKSLPKEDGSPTETADTMRQDITTRINKMRSRVVKNSAE